MISSRNLISRGESTPRFDQITAENITISNVIPLIGRCFVYWILVTILRILTSISDALDSIAAYMILRWFSPR